MQTENHYTETDLGNVSPNPRGDYNNTVKYEYLDLVTMQGGSYLCVIPVGQTITGTAPEPGKTTEHWQCLTMPGDMTPQYTEAHDKVVRLAKEVAQNTTKVAEDKQSVAQMETDVRQLKEQTAESARQAENSKDSAVGSARAAKTAEDNIRQVANNVNTLVNGFDTHVAEKTTEATQAVATAKDNAVQAVERQETASVQEVKDQTATYITEQKNLAKQELDDKVNQFGLDVNVIKAEVSKEGQKQITNVQEATTAELAKITEKGTEQTEAVAKEGTKQVQAVQAAAQEIITDREQINTNKEGVAKLKEDLTGLEEATLEKTIIEFIAKKELQQSTPISNNVEILKVDIKKNTSYTIKTNDVDEIIVGRGINLYEKYTDGRLVGIGSITGNDSIDFVAKNDIVSINIFVAGKNIAKNGVIDFKASVVKENSNSIESIAKSKVDSGYRVRRGTIFEIGSVTGNNVDTTRARSIPIRGNGVVSVKNIVKNNLLVTIRVWSDNPFGTTEFDSGWQKIENLIEYDVTNKYYSIGICHQDQVSKIDVNKLNSLGIKIYEKLPSLLTDEIISDIDYRLTRIEQQQQQQRTAGTIRNIAHRGDDIYAPQNTAPAYIEARKRGFTVGENDVAISKDGVYVVWHDVDLSRISISGFLKDINGYDVYTDGTDFYYKNVETGIIYTYINEYIQSDIESSNITQCKGIDYSVETLPYNVLSRIDFGVYMGRKFKGTKILTFEEWILLCKQLGMEVYIDKKFAYTDEHIEYMYNVVKKHGMLDKATWLDPLFDKLRSLDPNARMCTLNNPTS